MSKYFKSICLICLFVLGISGAATAALAVNFNGGGEYDYDNGKGYLEVLATAGGYGQFTFTATWDTGLSAFVESKLISGAQELLLMDMAAPFVVSEDPLFLNEINISGAFQVTGGLWAGNFPSVVLFSSLLILDTDFAGMAHDYKGNMNGTLTATPIPSAYSLLGLGITCLAGVRRARTD